MNEIAQDVYVKNKNSSDKDDIFEVIRILRPGCTFSASLGGGIVHFEKFWDPNNLAPPTSEEIFKEMDYQKEYKEYYQYAYDRCTEYPDGFEQFDMLWHAINNGENLKDSEWFQSIKEVKEKYPKPNTNPPIRNK